MSLFGLLEILDPLRGMPATWILLGAGFLAVAVWDVRLALPALGVHYLAAGLLFVDLLDPRLAIVYVLAGLIATAILLVTAAQVNWGRPPADLTAEERAQLRLEPGRSIGPFLITNRILLRALLAAAVMAVLWFLVQSDGISTNPEQVYLDTAIYGLMGLGIVGLATSPDPLRSGIGVMLLLTGFELSNSQNVQSLALVVALVAVNLLIAVVIAYMAQARFLPAESRD